MADRVAVRRTRRDRLHRFVSVPEHLRGRWTPDLQALHSAAWWRRHWERTGIVDTETADTMPGGWRRWIEWQRIVAPDNVIEISALEADAGRFLGYSRLVARRRAGAPLVEPVASVPVQYTQHTLTRV